MYLLDTNVLSETRKIPSGKANPAVHAWFAQTDYKKMFINAAILMEIERGVLQMERKDAAQGRILRQWYENGVLHIFEDRILPIDKQTASLCAALHIPNKSPENDAWIAASALQHQLTIATRNLRDFASLGVKTFNPFQATR